MKTVIEQSRNRVGRLPGNCAIEVETLGGIGGHAGPVPRLEAQLGASGYGGEAVLQVAVGVRDSAGAKTGQPGNAHLRPVMWRECQDAPGNPRTPLGLEECLLGACLTIRM